MLRAGALVVAFLPLTSGTAVAVEPRATPAKTIRVSEGAGSVRIWVKLSRPARRRASARFRAVADTASHADFEARRGRLRWRRGNRRAAIVIRLTPDAADEHDETFKVRLSRPRGIRFGRRRTTRVTIVDDDRPPLTDEQPQLLTAVDRTVTEPEVEGATAPHGLTVSLAEPARSPVTVRYSLVGAGATTTAADVDLASGELTFASGEMTKLIAGSVIGDALDEHDEQARLVLSDPAGAQLADPDASLTIIDDPADIPPVVAVADLAIAEAPDLPPAEVEVSLSAASGRPVSVPFSTADGTAVSAGAAMDYEAAAGTLTFQPGETRKTIAIQVLDDPRDEPEQAFAVVLAGPDGASLSDADGSAFIADDDPAPSISINDVTKQEANTLARFTVLLSQVSEKQVGFRVSTTSITATGGSACGSGIDYVSISSSQVSIDPMQPGGAIDVTICNDASDENNETANLVLSSLVDATIGDGTGVLTILDDDP